MGAYINDTIIRAIELQNNAKGYMDGRSLSVTFSLLRENSLYWNYYVDNYLKGQSPVDFDLLYWNSDSTNVAGACHNFLLRELYLENKLVQDKGVKVGGVWIDLDKIKVPSYFISTKEDHIALWQGTYRGALRTGGTKPLCWVNLGILRESLTILTNVSMVTGLTIPWMIRRKIGWKRLSTEKGHGGCIGMNG